MYFNDWKWFTKLLFCITFIGRLILFQVLQIWKKACDWDFTDCFGVPDRQWMCIHTVWVLPLKKIAKKKITKGKKIATSKVKRDQSPRRTLTVFSVKSKWTSFSSFLQCQFQSDLTGKLCIQKSVNFYLISIWQRHGNANKGRDGWMKPDIYNNV